MSMGSERAPMVSVIMIFLDPGNFFDEAIKSVLGQTAADLELLLVDDGSTDGSRKVADRWARVDTRVRVLAHPGGLNRGMGASRNLGLRAARGRWVAFLDSDDAWEIDHLDVHVAATRKHPGVEVIVSPALIWVSWRSSGEQDHVRGLPYPPDRVLPPGALLDSVTFLAVPVPTCGLFFRRDLAPDDGLGDPAFRGLFEDQTMVARLTVDAPAVVLPRATSRYRQHSASAVHRSPGRGSRDPATLRYLDWVSHFLDESGHLTPARRKRLLEVRAQFDPRWRFWLWYGCRWTFLHLLPAPVRRAVRRGRRATGVIDDPSPQGMEPTRPDG